MVAGTDRHAVTVQDLGEVVRVGAFEAEGQDRPLAGRFAMHCQPVDAPQGLARACIKRMLVRRDLGGIELPHPAQRRAEADGLKDRRRAGLKLVRGGVVSDQVSLDDFDHLAAALVGARPRQRF